MKKLAIMAALVVGASFGESSVGAAASWPAGVTVIDAKPNATTDTAGKIDEGKTIDLEFAQKSSNACFVAPAFDHYRGNHVFFATELPRSSDMIITVTPDEGAEINLYAYTIGKTRFDLPPELASCVTCEAAPSTSAKATGPRKIRLNATSNPYNVVIGVAGAKGVTKGGFKLSIDLKSKK